MGPHLQTGKQENAAHGRGRATAPALTLNIEKDLGDSAMILKRVITPQVSTQNTQILRDT